MTAKKSSITTVVSVSERGVYAGAVRDLSADFVGDDAVRDVVEVRRGIEGTESMDVRDGFRLCMRSVGLPGVL